jgi:molecular chaperone Hsp33
MQDYIIRGTDKDKNFRFFGANTKELVKEATSRHFTSPLVSAALGRTLTGTAMMGAMLKNEQDRVSVTIKGDGPIEGIVAEADAKGNVRGYAYHPEVELPLREDGKLDVAKGVGNAVMTVMKDIGLKEPYQGQVPMLSGEIADDFTFYFAVSEQTNSVVALGVLVDRDYSIKQAGGFIIQVLPGCKDEAIDALEAKLKEVTSVTALLDEGKTIEDILTMLLGELEMMATTPVKFRCPCSSAQMERGLISLGEKELQSILDDDQEDVELTCHFCNKKYHFSDAQLAGLIEEIKKK